MKKLILIIAIVFSGILIQAQEKQFTDLDIANALIGQSVDDLERIEKDLSIKIAYDGGEKMFVTTNGTTKYYRLYVSDYYEQVRPGLRVIQEDIIMEIFVRYTYSEHLHLLHFQEYELPEDSDSVMYEKKQGKNKAHLKLVLK